MKRRHLLLAAPALALPGRASAQGDWPQRPIRLVVPYPPAGGTDVISREIGGRIAALTGWTMVTENRPGAGGNIGIDTVAKSTDGHTVAMGQASNLAINPTLYATMPYQPLRDLAFISLVASQPNVLVTTKQAPYRSVADVVAAARRSPGRLTVGHPGNGTVGHLSGALFALRADVDITSVPYRGAAQVLTDLLAGRVDLFFADPLAVHGTLESGDLVALGVTSAERSPLLPAVPAIAEAGYPGFDAVNWTGLVGPAGMPAAVVARINAETRKALGEEEIIARLRSRGADPKPSTPEEFRSFVSAEIEKWAGVVRAAGVEVE